MSRLRIALRALWGNFVGLFRDDDDWLDRDLLAKRKRLEEKRRKHHAGGGK